MTLAGIAFDKAARASGFAQQNSFLSPLQVKRAMSNLERKRAGGRGAAHRRVSVAHGERG